MKKALESDPNISLDTLKNIMKHSSSNIFINEFEALNDDINRHNLINIQFQLKFNFFITKFNQYLNDYKLLKRLQEEQINRKKKYSEKLDFELKHYLDIQISEHSKLAENLTSCFINLLREYGDNDINEIKNLINNDPNSVVLSSLIEKTLEAKTSELIQENSEQKDKIYKLKVYYYKGSKKAQMIKIPADNLNNISSFVFNLKKKLGIFEFSSFNIVIKKNKKGNLYFN